MIDVAIPIGQYVRMGKPRTKSLILGMLLGIAPVFAGSAGVYTGSAPVATQSDQDRAAALRSALSQAVAQAAGGDASVLRRPAVARALSRPERYARQYSYQANGSSSEPGKAAAKFLLVVQFNAAQIDALVRDQLPASAPVPNAPAAIAAGGGAPGPATVDGDAASPPDAATAPSAGYRLWFSGLRSAEDYARLVGALNANPEVRTLRVEQARGSVLQVRIDARGSLQGLSDALEAARLAHPTNTKPPVEGVDAVFDFGP